MAKLCSCYTLCPLIDKGLIGVSEDSTPGCVIVTLGKNMVIRYKLSDQNQVGSWSSRDRLTGPVIYDSKRNHYVAVFNQSILREWTENESDLNKVKRFKTAQPVHVVLSCPTPGESVVVFKNGAVSPLPTVLSGSSPFKATLSGDFQIENCWILTIEDTLCVGIVASKEQAKAIFQLVSIETGKVLWRLTIQRGNNAKLLSKCTVKKGESAALLTLWSDGQLWSLPLKLAAPEVSEMGTQLYIITTVSTKHPIAMTQLSTNHIAVYGAEPNEEGAVLAVLNLKFLLVQARQHFKLFAAGTPQLWIHADKLLLIVGPLLTVVPYSLETEQLLALVGSLKSQPSNRKADTNDVVAVSETVLWNKKKKKKMKDKSIDSPHMPENIKLVAEQGFSQALLCEATLPSILNSRNMDDLLWVIKNMSDFPEVELVRLLLFCLEEPAKTFKSLSKVVEESTLEKIDYKAVSAEEEATSAAVWVPGRWSFLHTLLTVRFSELVIVPYLRGGLSLEQCLQLVERILRLTVALQDVDEIRTMLRWIAALLDSHHQQIILAGRHGVGSSLSILRDFVENKIEYMEDLRSLHPLLDQLVNRKLRKSVKPLGNTYYSVEPLSLY